MGRLHRSGGISEYRSFDTAYGFGGTKVMADGQKYDNFVIDYVGQDPLENGKYTFKVDTTANGYLEQELEQD
jgi:hypothetical protein